MLRRPPRFAVFPTRRSSDLEMVWAVGATDQLVAVTHDDDFPASVLALPRVTRSTIPAGASAREIDAHVREAGARGRSEEHTSELQSRFDLVCRLLLDKKIAT